jgi:hypothetical protein
VKSQIFFLPFFITTNLVIAQSNLPKLDTVQVDKFLITNLKSNQLILKNPFASSKIEKSKSLELLKGKEIEKIQLVYTVYPKNATLKKLNTRRLELLRKQLPAVFEKSEISWELVQQTDCETLSKANKLFHGFIFTFSEPTFSAKGRIKEVDKMRLLLNGKIVATDSTILKILDRNKQWKNMLVIADVTGSMSPYIGELLLWIKLNATAETVKSFVFFNDGDAKKDKEKMIGETGGIYSTNSQSVDSVLSVVEHSMLNGWGGDLPENNFEATLHGIEKHPEFEELIMIADNHGIPRDLSLLKEIKIPIRILLCGTKEAEVNPIYLEIVKRNGGSLHTIEQDLMDLVKLSEREIITVGKSRFQVLNGKFQRIKD